MRVFIATLLLVTACAGGNRSADTAAGSVAIPAATPAAAIAPATARADSAAAAAGAVTDEMRRTALPIASLSGAGKQTGSSATRPQGVAKAAGQTQWSGYISQVRYDGDRMYFVTPCQAPQQYWVLRSQVVSLNQNGLCGNYSQFYAVINY